MSLHVYILLTGKGGSKISDLQFESGCKINVTREQEDDHTLVILSGDVDGINKAKDLIAELTVERQQHNTVKTTNISHSSTTDADFEPIDWKKVAEEAVS